MQSTIPHLHHDTKLAIIIPYSTCILRQIYDARRWNYVGNSLSTHPSIEFWQNFPTEASPIVDIYSPTRGNGFLLSTPPLRLASTNFSAMHDKTHQQPPKILLGTA
jgi:hypothetical protein